MSARGSFGVSIVSFGLQRGFIRARRRCVSGLTQHWPYQPTKKTAKTEFEYAADDAFSRLLPKPGPAGFARGSFIRWRRNAPWNNDSEATSIVEEAYEISGHMGEGGFGTVFSARHRLTGEVVAIKRIPKDLIHEVAASKMEVEFLKVADHPNLIRYYETLEDEQHFYLVMEVCLGGPLSQHIKNAHDGGIGFSEREMARILKQMLRGLAYCHAHGIVHRDVKPQNFLFAYGEVQQGKGLIPMACTGHGDAPLKMVDFGISGVARTDSSKRYLTQRVGTDGFMAPEVLANRPYGHAADLFSLGAVWHTMIVGRPPRWESGKHAYTFPGSIRWRKLSPEGQSLLKCLLSDDPTQRPTASEAIQHPWFQAGGVGESKQDAFAMWYFMQEISDRILEFPRRSKLQRAIMYCMVAFANLHSGRIEMLNHIFTEADKGMSGGLTRYEFSTLLRSWGLDCSYTIESLFSAVNVSCTGSISYSEWLAAALPEEWYSEQDFRRVFDTLDVDAGGFICSNDLVHLLPQVFNSQELEHEIRCHVPGSGGKISFKNFCLIAHGQEHDGNGQWLYSWY